MWEGSIVEQKGKDGIGVVTVNWMVDSKVAFSHSGAVDGKKDMATFKSKAESARDLYLAKTSREDNLSTQITSFMNS